MATDGGVRGWRGPRAAHRRYVWSVATAGVGLAGLVLGGVLPAGAGRVLPVRDPGWWLTGGLLGFAELRPLLIPGADPAGVQTSTLFTGVLLLRFGLPAAVAAQAGATLLEGLVRRVAVRRVAFNVGQYTLSLAAAAVLLSAAGLVGTAARPLLLTGRELPAALAAAGVFVAVNDVLVSRAIALGTGQRTGAVLRAELGYQLATTGVLAVTAPLVAVGVQTSPGLVLLTVPPLVGVYWLGARFARSQHQAQHDPLTGLANRELLTDRAAHALLRARPTGPAGGRVGVLLLDLDGFKAVNDAHGHAAGDRLLQLAAARLAAQLRPTDTLARIGGDEFAVLAPDLAGAPAAAELADRLQAALATPFQLGTTTITVTVSVGAAVHPEHGTDLPALLAHADTAMYRNKQQPPRH